MIKELFVSSTPHETKVGLAEDDQLAEIYLERENEYTLAGSIYKGRVTRVLPGMQSAFVDIGLERDAFLYVSDFMELEDSEEVEEVAAHTHDGEHRQQPRTESRAAASDAAPREAQPEPQERPPYPAEGQHGQTPREPRETRSAPEGEDDRGGFRGRRRRRGRRGERMPESKFASPAPDQHRGSRPERPERPQRHERSDYGPPPGYQPILLPGESISKYQRIAQSQPPATEHHDEEIHQLADAPAAPIAATFPEDEPLFAGDGLPAVQEPVRSAGYAASKPETEPYVSPWDDEEQPRQHRQNVAAAFGEEPAADEHYSEPVAPASQVEQSNGPVVAAPGGTVEEEEIEEEEADLAHYVEELEEDAAFEEFEEETHAAADYRPDEVAVSSASVEPVAEVAIPFSAEPISGEEADVEQAEEVEESAAQEAELEEAQAEAEALLDAEARGNGSVDARAEVRAPAPTASYTQRTERSGFDRQRGQRGRRGSGRRFRRREPQNVPLISDLLKEGQEILVQIAKEPIGKKGARITSHIALPGRFLVYMPTVNHTGVSRKISSEEERQRLKRIILSERENGHGGFIVRTAAQNATEDELRADIRFLKGLWNEIKSRADKDKAPLLIYHDLNVVERVLRDQVTSDFSAIWVDNEQEYERILRFANRFQPALVKKVKLYSKETPLFEQFGLSEEINKALKSKVWLKSGGYIVINQTEALVAIDVNTGKYVGKTARLEDTIVKTNVDAIKEIVRQVRLRDLGGIIVIDFIDMDERRNRQKVMQALEDALRSDRAPSKVLQFNDFGLVAITRKRVKQSLERTIGTPCPYCTSTGYVKSVTTVCNEIYLEMRKISKHLEQSDVMLRVNPEVAKALKANNGRFLNELEELTKKTVIVKSDPAVHQEQFDIN